MLEYLVLSLRNQYPKESMCYIIQMYIRSFLAVPYFRIRAVRGGQEFLRNGGNPPAKTRQLAKSCTYRSVPSRPPRHTTPSPLCAVGPPEKRRADP